jgi:release factor glutamine methyltransferase
MNLVETIAEASMFLEKTGVASPRLNAEILLGHVLGRSRVEIYSNYEKSLADKEYLLFKDLLKRRAKGYPLQYITGSVGFRGIDLKVKPGVFIPRPETEILLEKAMEVLPDTRLEILDLCAGCGTIAVSLAVELKEAQVTAVDCNHKAVNLCIENAGLNNVSSRVKTLEGDLFGALEGKAKSSFDAILSNPPYIPARSFGSLPKEVRDFEPSNALIAGIDGLSVIRKIITLAPLYLKTSGWLLMEVDESTARTISGMLSEQYNKADHSDIKPGMNDFEIYGKRESFTSTIWSEVEIHNDLNGHARVVRARLSPAS